MTLADVVREIKALKREVGDLRELLEYERAVDGIRRGLASVKRGKGEPVKRAFYRMRRKYKLDRRGRKVA
jgi:hypothetical protein